MALLTLSCADLGSPCTKEFVSGNTIDDLMAVFYKHGAEAHGLTWEQMQAPERQAAFRSNIKQMARPQNKRTTQKLDL